MAELPRVATELPAKQPESWVYMVRCADGSLYTGWTENLYARMEAHRTGKGSKCVRGKGFEKLAWAERQPVPGRGPGQKREAQVKALPKEQKEAMAAQWAERMRPRLTMARPADGPQVLALYRWYVLNSTATFNWVPDTEENYIKMLPSCWRGTETTTCLGTPAPTPGELGMPTLGTWRPPFTVRPRHGAAAWGRCSTTRCWPC